MNFKILNELFHIFLRREIEKNSRRGFYNLEKKILQGNRQ